LYRYIYSPFPLTSNTLLFLLELFLFSAVNNYQISSKVTFSVLLLYLLQQRQQSFDTEFGIQKRKMEAVLVEICHLLISLTKYSNEFIQNVILLKFPYGQFIALCCKTIAASLQVRTLIIIHVITIYQHLFLFAY
jgi:hypothetical protein